MVEPTAVRILKLLETTSVRDRVYRLVQYATKLVSWLLQRQGVSKEFILKARKLEQTLSLARKLFRMGKSFDHLRVAMQTIHLKDPFQRFVITLAKLSRFLFLLFDHLVWFGRLQLFWIDAQKWSYRSTRFWFMGIFFGLLRDFYDLFSAVRVEQSRLRHDSTGAKKNLATAVSRMIQNNPALVLDTIKNSTDMFLPLSLFEVGKNISPGWVGLMGVVSTSCSLIAVWNEGLKLRYS